MTFRWVEKGKKMLLQNEVVDQACRRESFHWLFSQLVSVSLLCLYVCICMCMCVFAHACALWPKCGQQQQKITSALVSSLVFVSVRTNVCVVSGQVLLSVCACVRKFVLTTHVCWCTGAEVSDCLVSVGSKLWQFALTVNLEEFLIELCSCQTSKCFTFFSFSLFLLFFLSLPA